MKVRAQIVERVVPVPEDPIEKFLFDEIQAAIKSNQPISRYALIQMVKFEKKLPGKVAAQTVDEYCDDQFPHIPEYLGKEFLSPFIKTMSLVLAIAGVIFIGWATANYFNKQNFLVLYGLGAASIFFSALGYLRGVLTESESKVKIASHAVVRLPED